MDIVELLPCKSVPRKNKRNTRSSPSREPRPGNPSGTLLVVEPDVLARMSIAEYLRDCGYKVIEADTIEDVQKVIQSETTLQIVLVDVSHLDQGEGFALSKQIRDSHPGIDVILTSSVAHCADKAGDLCEEGVLGKPYHPEELLRRIHLLRERRRGAKLP